MIKGTTLFIFFAIIYNQGYVLLVPNDYSTRQVCSVLQLYYFVCSYDFVCDTVKYVLKDLVFRVVSVHSSTWQQWRASDRSSVDSSIHKETSCTLVQGSISPCCCAGGLRASSLSVMVASYLWCQEHLQLTMVSSCS